MKNFVIVLVSILFCFQAKAQNSIVDTSIDTTIIEQLDKLMDSWYAKKATYYEKSQPPQQHVSYSTTNEDSLIMLRLQALTGKSEFPMVFNKEVRSYVHLYTKRTRSIALLLGLAKHYFPMFEQTLDKYDCPLELKYLAIVESALNPTAVSKAGATGLWQFMYNTGKMYGLEVNTLVDYRRDPIRATDAAARHLKDLSNLFFGDWVLALAAYNCGPGNVKKAIVRSGGKTNYWEIYNYLPKETRGYVPAFYGAWYAMSYYDKYGIVPAEAKFGQTDTILLANQRIHFGQIAEVLHISIDEIKALNPTYKKNIIPASNDAMILVLPTAHIKNFLLYKDSIANYKTDSFFSSSRIAENVFSQKTVVDQSGDYRLETKYHTVKSGESLSIIAKKYGTTPTAIANLNKISVSGTIHPAQRLVVGHKKIYLPTTAKDSTKTPSTADSTVESGTKEATKNIEAESSTIEKEAAPSVIGSGEQPQADNQETRNISTQTERQEENARTNRTAFPVVDLPEIVMVNSGFSVDNPLKTSIKK